MGRGPPIAITRKLIRNYFRFDLNRSSFDSAKEHMQELQISWEKYGMNSIECQTLQKKIDFYNQKDNIEYMRMKKEVKSLPSEMNKLTFKPHNKYYRKGRQREPVFFREDSEKEKGDVEDRFFL
jgi:hypothetical protein